MNITELEPNEIWNYFSEICKIPHPSGKEDKMVEYLKQFAENHKLEYVIDESKNVLIKKNASSGRENDKPMILQSHIDMVCEKNKDIKHDFNQDPLDVYIENDWVKARNTTLGADDGIGVAAQLAILASDSISHPELECLFTVEEETGLTGAINLKKNFLKGRRLVNLDSEDDGIFCIGCAGGIGTEAQLTFKKEKAPADMYYMEVSVKGLNGGHSGEDIDKEHGNAIKILARILYNLSLKIEEFRIADINGGNLHNAIPREASAICAINFKDKENARILINIISKEIEEEYPSEEHLKIELNSVSPTDFLIDKDSASNLLLALNACPHGVIRMSKDIEGLVETSTNLASIKTENNIITIVTSQRSSVESRKREIKDQISCLFKLTGAKVTNDGDYPGWEPNLESAIKNVAVETYEKLFNQKPIVQAIHAGLECGLILEKYPDMDMVSIGPTIEGNHSPAEKLSISATEKFWKHLIEILKH